jgi:hypothetical protein
VIFATVARRIDDSKTSRSAGKHCAPEKRLRVCIVMHRQLVERFPFELHSASSADFADDLVYAHTAAAIMPFH